MSTITHHPSHHSCPTLTATEPVFYDAPRPNEVVFASIAKHLTPDESKAFYKAIETWKAEPWTIPERIGDFLEHNLGIHPRSGDDRAVKVYAAYLNCNYAMVRKMFPSEVN